jgi:hypothetical protein
MVLIQAEDTGSIFFIDSSTRQFLRTRSSKDVVAVIHLINFLIYSFFPNSLIDSFRPIVVVFGHCVELLALSIAPCSVAEKL